MNSRFCWSEIIIIHHTDLSFHKGINVAHTLRLEVLHFQGSLLSPRGPLLLNALIEGWISNLETLMGSFPITSPLAIDHFYIIKGPMCFPCWRFKPLPPLYSSGWIQIATCNVILQRDIGPCVSYPIDKHETCHCPRGRPSFQLLSSQDNATIKDKQW